MLNIYKKKYELWLGFPIYFCQIHQLTKKKPQTGQFFQSFFFILDAVYSNDVDENAILWIQMNLLKVG